MAELLAQMDNVSSAAWWTIAGTTALFLGFEGFRLAGTNWRHWRLGREHGRDPLLELDFKRSAASRYPVDEDADEDDDAKPFDPIVFAFNYTVAVGGILAADLAVGWQAALAGVLILSLPLLISGWLDFFDRREMFEQQQIEHEPYADTIFDDRSWLSLPPEAVWGFLGALGLLGAIVGLILWLD